MTERPIVLVVEKFPPRFPGRLRLQPNWPPLTLRSTHAFFDQYTAFALCFALGGYTFPGTAADSAAACAAPSEVDGADDEVDSAGMSTGLGE